LEHLASADLAAIRDRWSVNGRCHGVMLYD